MSSLDYADAEKRGYLKLDLLNVHVYNMVRDEQHLIELMREPDWSKLKNKDFVEKLIHLGNQYSTLRSMPEPIDSIPRLAMFLAIIRPGKKHLIGKSWKDVAKTVWDKGSDGYTFKKSHAIAYSHLVVVHMNLLEEVMVIV
jgi:DNA polymerase III alpha subunit